MSLYKYRGGENWSVLEILILNSLAISLSLQDIAYYAGAIFVFGVMIFVHELGHFLIAKRMGIRVEEFSMGFGPKIISKKIGETYYSWRAVPLGGFVQMTGEDGGETEDNDDPGNFQNVSFFARIATVAAGPIMNYITAFLVFFLLYFCIGDLPYTTELGRLNPGYPAFNAGLKQGDIILSINGKELKFHEGMKMRSLIKGNSGKELDLVVDRNGEELNFQVTPTEQGILGFEMSYGSYITIIVEIVIKGSPEEKGGLKKGDQVVWIQVGDDKEKTELDYNSGMKIIQHIRGSEGKKITLGVNRKGEEIAVEFNPKIMVHSRRCVNSPFEETRNNDTSYKMAANINYEKDVDFNFGLRYLYERQGFFQSFQSALKETFAITFGMLMAISESNKRRNSS